MTMVYSPQQAARIRPTPRLESILIEQALGLLPTTVMIILGNDRDMLCRQRCAIKASKVTTHL